MRAERQQQVRGREQGDGCDSLGGEDVIQLFLAERDPRQVLVDLLLGDVQLGYGLRRVIRDFVEVGVGGLWGCVLRTPPRRRAGRRAGARCGRAVTNVNNLATLK